MPSHVGEGDNIEGLVIEDPAIAVNRTAEQLRASGVDLVITLVHEGAATSDPSAVTDTATIFGRIVQQISPPTSTRSKPAIPTCFIISRSTEGPSLSPGPTAFVWGRSCR